MEGLRDTEVISGAEFPMVMLAEAEEPSRRPSLESTEHITVSPATMLNENVELVSEVGEPFCVHE